MRSVFVLLFVLCCLLIVPCVGAVDVGLALDQNVEYSGSGDNTAFAYNGIAIPRVSGLLGENAEFLFSAGLSYKSDPWAFVPELLQTGISGRSGGVEFEFGRMTYSDPLGYIASGLFDGGRFTFDTAAGYFSVGAWYTGLLYKKRVNVEMTDDEWTANNSALDYEDFINTYFAPGRVLGAVDWAHQGLWDRVRAKLSMLGQFDLTGNEKKLNSQYLAGKVTVLYGAFSFDLGGCFELIELIGANDDIGSAFAAELGFAWRNPVHYLSLGGKYSSGGGGTQAAFLPLTTNTQRYILAPKLSANTVLSLDYIVRLREAFSVGFYPAYFILNDSESVKNKRFLGGEIYGACYWSPVPDISINFGGGVFLPSLGDIAPDEKSFWRVGLNVVLSLF